MNPARHLIQKKRTFTFLNHPCTVCNARNCRQITKSLTVLKNNASGLNPTALHLTEAQKRNPRKRVHHFGSQEPSTRGDYDPRQSERGRTLKIHSIFDQYLYTTCKSAVEILLKLSRKTKSTVIVLIENIVSTELVTRLPNQHAIQNCANSAPNSKTLNCHSQTLRKDSSHT